MSDELDDAADPATASVTATVMEAEAALGVQAPPDGAPAAPELAAFERAAPHPGPRPVLGPSLWVSGVLTWAYVVMGILTTTRFGPKRLPLGEGAAVFWVLAAAGSAGYFAVQRSLAVTQGGAIGPRAGRIVSGALLIWLLFLIAAIVIGQVGDVDGFMTLFLAVGGGAAVWFGRRLTDRGSAVPGRPRHVAIGCWIGATVVTVVAMLLR